MLASNQLFLAAVVLAGVSSHSDPSPLVCREDDISVLESKGAIVDTDVRNGVEVVVKLNVRGIKHCTELSRVLKSGEHIETLDLGETDVDDKFLRELSPLKRIRILLVDRTSITAKGLKRILSNSIENLALDSMSQFEAGSLGTLGSLPNLRVLSVRDNRLDKRDVAWILEHSSIRHLDLSKSQVPNGAVAELLSSPRLEILDASNLKLGEVRWPTARTRLEHLNLSDSDITNEQLVGIGRLRELTFLSLNGTTISAPGVAEVAKLPKLKSLQLINCKKVDDTCVRALTTVPKLQKLDARGTLIKPSALRKALPNIKLLVGGARE